MTDGSAGSCMMEKTPYFAELVRRELASARIKHDRPIATLFDGYGTIKEEVDEFWDELKKRDRDKNAILKELVQVAAMCQRVAEDLGMVPLVVYVSAQQVSP